MHTILKLTESDLKLIPTSQTFKLYEDPYPGSPLVPLTALHVPSTHWGITVVKIDGIVYKNDIIELAGFRPGSEFIRTQNGDYVLINLSNSLVELSPDINVFKVPRLVDDLKENLNKVVNRKFGTLAAYQWVTLFEKYDYVTADDFYATSIVEKVRLEAQVAKRTGMVLARAKTELKHLRLLERWVINKIRLTRGRRDWAS